MSAHPDNFSYRLTQASTKLDTNPAQGAMLHANVMYQQNFVDRKGGSVAHESTASLWDKFVRASDRFDAFLQGSAKQGWGMDQSGKAGDSKASTASKPTKNAVYFNSGTADVKELLEIFDLILLSMGGKVPGDMKASMEAKKDELFVTWKKIKEDPFNETAKTLFELREKVEKIKEEMERAKDGVVTGVVLPQRFKSPGNADLFPKYAVYFVKATNGTGLFGLSDLGHSKFKIYTAQNRLYPLDMLGVNADQILKTYPSGCTFEYVGDEGLFPYLPTP